MFRAKRPGADDVRGLDRLASAEERIAPRLAEIFTHAAVGLCELDREGRFLLVNDALCSLLGRTAEDLLGLGVADVTHPTDLAPSLRLLESIARDGQIRSIDKRYRRPDGQILWARSTVARLERDGDGDGDGNDAASFLVVIVDLSDQRRAEHALVEGEQRARTLIDGIARSTWQTDGAGHVVLDSPSWRAHTGQSFDAWVSDGWLDAVHPDDREYAQRHWREALAARRMVNGEFRIRRATGGYDWMNVRAAPMVDDNGDVLRWMAMNIDISARKSAEAALRASELRLQTLVSGVPQLVWRAIAGGEWTWASPQWERATGQSPRKSLGFGWLEAVHPDDREVTRERWSQASVRGALEVEHRLRNAATGSYCWFQTRASPVRLDDGTIVEWLGTSTDVDDLRALQERQRILVAELQHRTRNLLGLVSVISDKALLSSADLSDYRRRFKDRLGALGRVQGLLSRADENDRVMFDRLLREELAAHGIVDSRQVTLHGPGDLALRPQCIQPLAMALHELSTNAVKHGASSHRGGRLEVRWQIETIDHAPWLHIDWRESGVDLADRDGPSNSSGQGRELIERALPYQLEARTRYTLTRDGVICSILVPGGHALAD